MAEGPLIAIPSAPGLVVGFAAGAVALLLLLLLRRSARHPGQRVAVLGSADATAALAAELERHADGHTLVGRIAPDQAVGPDPHWLGPLDDLRSLVLQHDIDLLLLTRDAPRMRVFEELDRSCADLPVRFCEMSHFYERVFGHVPIAELTPAWLQFVLHPRFSARTSAGKRAFDVAASLVLGLLAAPLVVALAVLIRRDGGPAFYRQVRVGERGRQFTLIKLRTMRFVPGADSTWTQAGDDRVTPLGRLLRRTHLDELPQLLNVLRGEMSIVGPRPEQPRYVEVLEHRLPLYSRRHTLRPGLTGWAQVRCGYGGSPDGTAWKLSHDFFYLKHRGFLLDAKILLLTLPTPFVGDPFEEPQCGPLVLGPPAVEARRDAPAPAVRPGLAVDEAAS